MNVRKTLRSLIPDVRCESCENYFNCKLRKSIFNRDHLICEKYINDPESKGLKLERILTNRKIDEVERKSKETWMEGL